MQGCNAGSELALELSYVHDILNFYFQPNPSSRTMASGSTHPLTEMSTRNLPGGKGRTAPKADNLTGICEQTVYKMWEPRRAIPFFLRILVYLEDFFICRIV
jgi:hypothetical protein